MKRVFYVLIVLLITSCSSQKQVGASNDVVNITFLQLNDVYEISPLEGGQVGGLARVATIKAKLLAENPNTYTVLAGDFLNPSLIGTLKHNGERISGRHMVDVLNTMGLDYACFGNHEFDLKEEELLSRINQAEFNWVSGNIKHKVNGKATPFMQNGKLLNDIATLNVDGLSIGLFSYCLPANKVDYIDYGQDNFTTFKNSVTRLKTSDILIGLTHQKVEDDIALAVANPSIDLIMGGHEHTNMLFGRGNAVIAKADANAKTVYVHRLWYNKKTKDLKIASELIVVDESIPEQSKTKAVADKWDAIANASFASTGFSPNEVLRKLSAPYDARESTIRWKQAPFPKMIARAMLAGSRNAEVAIVNSGSIRVDDMLSETITQYDILRALPFGGGILEVEMTGELLTSILQTGWKNTNSGGYLQWAGIDRANDKWEVLGKQMNEQKIYTVALTEFLLTGLERNLNFLTPNNPGIISIDQPTGDKDIRRDIRLLVIDYLKKGGN